MPKTWLRILGAMVGAIAGFYGGAYARVYFLRWREPGIQLDYHFEILWYAILGACVGTAAGSWLIARLDRRPWSGS